MIRLCIFDMGGVYVTNHDTAGKIAEFIGLDGVHSYSELEAVLGKSLSDYTRGLISEDELWRIFTEKTGKSVDNNPSIFGRFFAPIINPETDKVIRELKADGMRVVCGTNVVDVHYDYHNAHSQYAIFDKVYPSHLMHIDKPDTEFFRYIAEAEHVSPEECFFTDDSKANADSARSIGMRSYQFTDAASLRENLVKEGVLV